MELPKHAGYFSIFYSAIYCIRPQGGLKGQSDSGIRMFTVSKFALWYTLGIYFSARKASGIIFGFPFSARKVPGILLVFHLASKGLLRYTFNSNVTSYQKLAA